MRKHALLRLKVARKDLDGDGIILVGVPQRGEIVVIGELRGLSVVHHQGAQVLGIHIEMYGVCKSCGIHMEGVCQIGDVGRHLRRHLVHKACSTGFELGRNRGRNLVAYLLHNLPHGLLEIGRKLVLHVIGHCLL